MCGIAGFVLSEHESASENLVKQMGESISYRGPDNQSEFIRGNAAFVHRRLSILDLEARSNQPMLSPCGKVVLTYNGEVYNFKNLRDQLVGLGHQFKTTSDTEVILMAYLEWGEKSFALLNGMFAFCLYDFRTEAKTYLVRDRAGIKPLFYSLKSGLSFASELKPMMKLPWIEKTIEKESLFLFFKHGHIPTTNSIFGDIKQLEPGSFLTYKNGSVKQSKFWSSSSLKLSNPITSEKEALLHLDSVFEQVVADQLVSDVPIGCFLSGGIDSSLLTYYFSKNSTSSIKTFSIGYNEVEFDESIYAKEVADILKTDHHEFIVSPSDLYKFVDDIPKFYDQPFCDPTLMPTMLLCQKAREHVTVALSGDGGDELFFGYLYHEMLYKLGALRHIPFFVRKMFLDLLYYSLGLLPKIPLKLQQVRKFCEILQFKSSQEFMSYFIGTIGPIRMDRIGTLLNMNTYPVNDRVNRVFKNESEWIARIEQVFYETFMLDTVLAKTDRASMAYSLEVRVPFLDNRMLELSSRIPFSLKYKNGEKKYLLRQLLRDKLPPSIVNRKKQGFSIPLREWIRGDLNFLVQDYLNQERLQATGLINPKEVQKLINDHMSNRANNSHLLWSLITFMKWYETYMK